MATLSARLPELPDRRMPARTIVTSIGTAHGFAVEFEAERALRDFRYATVAYFGKVTYRQYRYAFVAISFQLRSSHTWINTRDTHDAGQR